MHFFPLLYTAVVETAYHIKKRGASEKPDE